MIAQLTELMKEDTAMTMTIAMPRQLLDPKYSSYLDNLRKQGVVNMFGAAPYLVKQFDIPIDQANKILAQWMKEFKNE
jgi:hypothetical protein